MWFYCLPSLQEKDRLGYSENKGKTKQGAWFEMSGKSVRVHEERYWHLPKFGLLPLAGFLVFSVLACLNFGLLDWSWFDLEAAKTLSFADISLVYVFVVEYVFIVLAVVSLVALAKGGYGELKPIEEEGLVEGLIVGLVWGLIGGLILGLIGGLIAGLILGLIGGLVWCLIGGLIGEFK